MEEINNLIDSVVAKLELPDSIKEDARRIASSIVESRLEGRYNPVIVALSSIIIACRLNGIGLGLKQISTLVPGLPHGRLDSRKAAKKAYELARRYMEVHRLQARVAGYEDYVRIASKLLGIQGEYLGLAEDLARAFRAKYGRRLKPMAVAGAAIYVALRKTGGPRMTLASICEKLKVTEPTLRNAIRLMRNIA